MKQQSFLPEDENPAPAPKQGASVTRTARVSVIRWSNNEGVLIGVLASGESFKSTYMPHVFRGDAIKITGRWDINRKFGPQIIVDHYMYAKPEELTDLDQLKAHEVLSFLHLEDASLGGLLGLEKLGNAIFRSYGLQTKEIILKNPYAAIRDVRGFGFRNADKLLARKLGIEEFDPRRIDECVFNILESASGRESNLGDDVKRASNAGEGHAFLPYSELVSSAAKALELDYEFIDESILRLSALDTKSEVPAEFGQNSRIIIANVNGHKAVYLPRLYHAERGVVRHIERLLAIPPSPLDFDPKTDIGQIKTNDETGPKIIDLSDDQKLAVETTLQEKLTVITGGPGVGKTTIVKEIVDIARRLNLTVHLCAPTGKAARRLEAAAGAQASTIHKLLGYNPRRGGFACNAKSKLPTDIVICDESSMVELPIGFALLDALPDHARLILVGDIDQLPPVGPGTFFRDIIASGRAKVIRLETIFRQSLKSSLIIQGSRSILAQQMPEFGTSPTQHDLFHFTYGSSKQAIATICNLVISKIPALFGIKEEDIQVLAPTYKGGVGVIELNKALQFALKGCNAEVVRFITGDRVIHVNHNNYDQGVYNGDVGYIIRQDAKHVVVDIDGQEFTFTESESRHLDLAYAISIHRGQGSEWPAVIVVVPEGARPEFFNRNMLYTALTRGKRLTIIVSPATSDTITPILAVNQKKRYGLLLKMLTGELPMEEHKAKG